jgi:hypothetical protein
MQPAEDYARMGTEQLNALIALGEATSIAAFYSTASVRFVPGAAAANPA